MGEKKTCPECGNTLQWSFLLNVYKHNNLNETNCIHQEDQNGNILLDNTGKCYPQSTSFQEWVNYRQSIDDSFEAIK